ncbi:hypothetical protein A946_02155 [Methylacidiphilum kamchatkense Kam1]|uniref:Uncharacterized protein n=1 Tax=Methylacidiphilum kamchatkense Kam1 TaxID=1202785 RepID=A0A0C1RN84_9BACT|nr:hypothetical protein A946_02155 [Methylacidiphilum kamchatkense Kam1]QDQ42512.1 hypothetical protein kam1_1287 [Methylacidiphilum kamchatkense Kam1]
MRLILRLKPEDKKATLPIHYNEFIQAFIYNFLDYELSNQLHEEGFVEGKRGSKQLLANLTGLLDFIRSRLRYLLED